MPPGFPSPIAQDQDGVDTVGPVPMTFGYGPNAFPHSAAHVLNNNPSPSNLEGNQNNNLKNMTKTSHFTGSTFNVVPNSNKDVSKNPSFTLVWQLAHHVEYVMTASKWNWPVL